MARRVFVMREKNIFHFPANGLMHLICEVSKVKEYWLRLFEEAGAWSLADWIATAVYNSASGMTGRSPELWNRFSSCEEVFRPQPKCVITAVTRKVTSKVTHLPDKVCRCSRFLINSSEHKVLSWWQLQAAVGFAPAGGATEARGHGPLARQLHYSFVKLLI
jgi:hypothetical protein